MSYEFVPDLTEEEYRLRFELIYCRGPIITFDGITVRFRKPDFDHCCFESSMRNEKKDTFSHSRAKRLHWIKETLEDPEAELYAGWDKKKKRYDQNRRVALVNGDYAVIIRLTGPDRATFITAYHATKQKGRYGQKSTVELIRQGPRWRKKTADSPGGLSGKPL